MRLHPPSNQTVRTPESRKERAGSRPERLPPRVVVARPPPPRYGVAEVVVIAVLALAVRLVYLDHAPYIDELNHALAARSVLEDGSLRINGGTPYARSWAFTLLVAGAVALFGDTLVVGRIPAVVAGTVLVVAVFLWVRAVSNRWGAWTAALLLCFAPISIYLSQQVRFYTLQTLFFWLGAIAVYTATASGTRTTRSRLALAAAALVCFVCALHLQPVSAVGITAVALWVLLDRAPAAFRWLRRKGIPRGAVAAGGLAVAAGVLALLATTPAARRAAQMFQTSDPWADHSRTYLRFYHDIFVEQYATIWTLLPLFLLLAASRYARPAGFTAVVFAFAFLFHSTAAWKHERYLFYALPFFFAGVGLGTAVLIPWLRTRFDAILARLPVRGTPALRSAAFAAALMAIVLFAAAGNRATNYTVKMLTLSDADWHLGRAYRGEADWAAAAPELRTAAANADFVVTSAMLKALYYLGRVDMGLTASELSGRNDRPEFSVVPKEAVPVISRPESLELVRGCYRSGLIIAEQRNWRQEWGVTNAVADYLESNLSRASIRARSGVLVFRWDNPAADFRAHCDVTRGSRMARP